jgi:hypothetical protein
VQWHVAGEKFTVNAGAGMYRYMPLDNPTAYDGQIEAIGTALRLLNLHQGKFETGYLL